MLTKGADIERKWGKRRKVKAIVPTKVFYRWLSRKEADIGSEEKALI